MAKSHTWDRATITPDEIEDVLLSQCGRPEDQTIVINMSDRDKQIPYKSAAVSCTCTRCNSNFVMTPKNICNAMYVNGYVCINCGPLSDSEVRKLKEEKMREQANKIAEEETGMTPEQLMELKEKAHTDEALSFEDLKARAENSEYESYENEEESAETTADIFAEALADEEDEEASASESVTTSEEPAPEETSVESAPVETEEVSEPEVEETKEDVQEEVEEPKVEDEKKEEIPEQPHRKPIDMEEAILKAQAAVKDEFAEEDEPEEKPVVKSESAKDLETEKEAPKAEEILPPEEPEPVRDENEEKVDEGEQTSQETQEEPDYDDTDASEEPEEDNDSLEVDFGGTPSEETPNFYESGEDDEADSAIDEPKERLIRVGDIDYPQNELDNVWQESIAKATKEFGYTPWDETYCEVEDGTILVKCRICRTKVRLSSFAKVYEKTHIDKKFFEQYGTAFTPLDNNADGSVPYVSECPICKASIATNGYNSAHRSAVLNMCKLSHLNCVSDGHHHFIYSPNEMFEVEANGVQKEITYIDLVKKFGRNAKDARKDPMFQPVKPKAEEVKTTESVAAAKTSEPEGIKIIHSIPPVKEEPKPITPKVEKVEAPKTPIKENNRPKLVFGEDIAEENIDQKAKEAMNQKLVLGEMPTEKADRGPDLDKKGPFIFGIQDTHEPLREEIEDRKDEFKTMNVFKEGAKLKLAQKNVAALNGKINPFKRNDSLFKSFMQTDFYRFFDSLSSETGVDFKVTVNNRTLELPFVDFATGWRFICCDLDDGELLYCRYNDIIHAVPFAFKEQEYTDVGNGELKQRPLKYKTLILFSDSIRYRRDATYYALLKYVCPEKVNYNGAGIRLQDNIFIQYSTNDSYLRNFDARYSTFPAGKPMTGHLGIIASWEDLLDGRTALNIAAQMHKEVPKQDLDSLQHERDQYMVCSIRYIEKQISTQNAVSPTRLMYTITDYVEIGTCLLDDGLTQCIRALLNEYKAKYPLASEPPYIKIELDPNVYFSPSILKYVERGILLPVDETYKIITSGNMQMYRPQGVERHLKSTYVRRPEYRPSVHGPQDEQRHDVRMFNIGTLLADPNMRQAIEKAGMSVTIRDPSQKELFLQNMGYEYCNQFQVKEMYVNQSIIASLMNDDATVKLQKLMEDNIFTNTKLVANSQSGSMVNNIMANPQLALRYQKLMQNGSKESKDYLRRAMFQQMYGVDYSDQLRQQQMSGMNVMGGAVNPFMMGMGMGVGMMAGMNMGMGPMQM